jgi:FemAB-related protein (PEP-CTERM system-associated)
LSLLDLPSALTGPLAPVPALAVRTHDGGGLSAVLPRLEAYLAGRGQGPLSYHPGWLAVLARGLRHVPYCLEAVRGEKTAGFLALADVRSLLFGRFLVSLPYLNYGGVVADDPATGRVLIDAAVRLADKLGVRHLELRHERPVEHTAAPIRPNHKVLMRLDLPATPGQLWDRLSAKVRNQVRKGQKGDLKVSWGGLDLLADFHDVFSRNMRDLGTPVYGRGLFRAALEQFPDRAEFCIVRAGERPVAGALLLHGWGVTEVPSASSLREYNPTNANMLMYWHLLERAVQRGQRVFDFGRSTVDGSTFRFKKQWGAQPAPVAWQSYVRRGTVADLKPDSPRYQKAVRVWRRLPLWLTRCLGPWIVRGIP